MGTLGVLIQAKENKHLDSLKIEIEKLRRVNFRMSEKLIEDILEKYGD